MKNKILIMLCFIIIFNIFNTSTTLADSINNKGVKFVGKVIATNKYYEDDMINESDINIEGICIDGEGNSLNIQKRNIWLPNVAKSDGCKYSISLNGKECFGNIDIEVLPFDSTVNYNSLNIKSVKFNLNNPNIDIEDIKLSTRAHLWQQIEKINFSNNIGHKLSINYDEIIVDMSDVQFIAGEYIIPYTVNFYTGNINKDNKYNSVSGTFTLTLEKFEDFKSKKTLLKSSVTPSLTAKSLVLSTLDTSFDININNKPSDGATYSWKSSNTKVATVNNSGVIKPISEGEANITCIINTSDGNRQELKSTVKVGIDDNIPILSDEELFMDVGDIYKIDVENIEVGSKIKFTSSNKNIAKVSVNGKVTGVSEGNCFIMVTITNGTDVIVLKCDIEI